MFNELMLDAERWTLFRALGGGTAAILTYVLREQKEVSTTTCVTFAPDFRYFFRGKSSRVYYLYRLQHQLGQTILGLRFRTVHRSASALGSRLPSIASAKAKVVGAGEILCPVTSGTQIFDPLSLKLIVLICSYTGFCVTYLTVFISGYVDAVADKENQMQVVLKKNFGKEVMI
ncbi:hypothetical protein CTI12_AA396250 [Artemisia annua]|uniref:Uncharacterized protein n=1 Tax=Artemisia annua TaxID=35608 RepID=A0A2U1MB85_ARTAN|nr:hypothetical protein CTI12_AA396250 [Artemisia annua]